MTRKSSLKKSSSSRRESIFPVSHPRGTQDILPAEQKYWEYVVETAKAHLRGWDFQRIDVPIFEETPLFVRAVGEDTDIVSKEMFELKVRGKGASYALRPEGTAGVARAYIEHGMRSWPHPVKLFYVGPFFRYDRPQAGRFRQFHQVGFEMFGSAAPITDAHIVFIAHLLFRQLGLEDYTVKINSLGEPGERKGYLKVLKEHFRRNRSKLCKDCKVRLTTNPLRLLDCTEEKCQQVQNTAPQLLDHLGEASKQHFTSVLSTLEELEVPHEVSASLVRGLDYYTHTVFEVVPKVRGEGPTQSSVAAGGRYDGLVKILGGKAVAAAGAAVGVERVIDRLKEEGVDLTVTDKPQVFIAQLGDEAKRQALRVMSSLAEAGIPFSESINRDSMQQQLKLADRLQVTWTVIIGHKEVLDKTVILRNMESGMQEVIPQGELADELKKRLNISAEAA